MQSIDFKKIPLARLQALSRIAFTQRARSLTRLPQQSRIATLTAFAYVIEATAQDDVLDILQLRVKELLAKSERVGKQRRLRTLRDLDAAALKLSQACHFVLDDTCADDQLRATIFAQVGREQLARAVTQVENLARPADDAYYPEVLVRYSQVRQFLPLLLKTIEFQASPSGQTILAAWQFLRSIEGLRRPDLSQAPLGFVKKGWKRWVIKSDGQIDRRAYTFCLLEQLLNGLSRRDFFVCPSVRWNNPRAKLLQGEHWESLRPQVCRALNLEPTPQKELEQLQQQLNVAYERTASNWETNSAVRIELEKKRETLILSHLDKLKESASFLLLKRQVVALLPRVDLPEVILEIQAKTGFIDEFLNFNQEKPRAADFATSMCAVLIATACNVGLRPLIRPGLPALTRDRLVWVQQNYLRPETLANANARLVAAQSTIALAQAWGGGEVASADGLRFVVPVRSLNAGPNSKYFGRGRGITYYNFTSDQFTGLHGLVVPGTLRDSLVLLVGLLEQRTSLQPKEIMTDTSGYSDVIFGLFWLLGYQFSPRLADIGQARFWRLDSEADYGVLDKLARQQVNTQLIEDNWDDLLRVAGSLKLGTVSALEIMRTLQKNNKPSTLAKAIGELGRVAKTLYLLNYVDDEDYRRRILTQINRGEGRHSLARAVFHGRKGEVRQPYPLLMLLAKSKVDRGSVECHPKIGTIYSQES